MSDQTVHFTGIREKIMETLLSAKSEVVIAVAWLTDEKMIESLVRCVDRGVKVSIVIYDDQINDKNLFKELYYKSQDIRVSKKLMHNKFCVIDKKTVINGSYNWTYNAKTNHENIQITVNNESLANSFLSEFRTIQSHCEKLDIHFRYSLDSILSEEQKFFQSYYNDNEKFSIPYFYKITNDKSLKVSPKIKDGYYLIKSEEEEKNFFKLKHFAKSNYKLPDVEKVLNPKFSLPEVFDGISIRHKSDKTHFNSNQIVVLKDAIYGGKGKLIGGRVFHINKKGEKIGIEILISHPTNFDDDLYVGKDNKIYDKNLNIIFQGHGEIEAVIKGIGIVTLVNKKYGLFNFNGTVKLPHCYNYHEISPNNTSLCLSENPLFYIRNDSSTTYIKKYTIDNSRNREFHLSPRKQTEILSTGELSSKIINDNKYYTFYFYSDENFKHGEFYKQLYNRPYEFVVDENRYGGNSGGFITSYLKNRENFETAKINFIKAKHLSPKITDVDFFDELYEKLRQDHKAVEKRKRCYIATLVYEDIDHPKVEFLRNFRDDKLLSNYLGRIFVKLYYKTSPKMVTILKPYNKIQKIIRFSLDKLISILQ